MNAGCAVRRAAARNVNVIDSRTIFIHYLLVSGSPPHAARVHHLTRLCAMLLFKVHLMLSSTQYYSIYEHQLLTYYLLSVAGP